MQDNPRSCATQIQGVVPHNPRSCTTQPKGLYYTNQSKELYKTHPHGILQVPTTQLAEMSFDPKFVELTADVLEIFL